jgi:hypothetical protein
MSGIYGTVKPADIDIDNDVEIFYNYRQSFNTDDTDFTNFQKINTPSSVLKPCTYGDNNAISGLFNLSLSLNDFGQKGIYTIYIKPKEINVEISDIGVLAAFPDIRGVVFRKADISSKGLSITNNSLVGYRIEYTNEEGQKDNEYKIITSSNLATASNYMLTNTSDNSSKYYYNNTGELLFCTVTPSLSPTFNPNAYPNIGNAGQTVKLVNTKFNPIMIELEMVEHDDETITNMLEGNQLIDKDNALITTFNQNGEIYHQSEYGTYKNGYGTPLYEFKIKKDNIDFNQSFENLE